MDKRVWLVAALLALPSLAGAAGLGKLTVKSALGEPLLAEIELVAVQREELTTLTAKLASREVFTQSRLDYLPVLSSFHFSVELRADATPFVKVTSTQPVNEPFVDMLVELTWSGGKLLREYTFLLDPPGAPTRPAAPAEAKPVPPVGAPAKPAPPAPQAAPAPSAMPTEAATYGPVKWGDTLGKIARQMRPEGVSLEQMLVALYRANPDAFSGKNMNRLKTGPILRVPAANEITAVETKEAVQEVKVQARDWNAYKQKLAAAAVPIAEAPKQVAEGKITTKVEEGAAPAAGPKEVLKLSKGEPPAGGKDTRSLEARIQSMQEESIAKDKALKEANERVAQLENNIKEMRKLLELKGAAPPAPPKPAAEAKPEAKPEPKPAEAPKPEAAPAPAAEKPAEAKPAEAPKPEPEAAKPAAPKPAAPKPAAPKPRPPEPSFLDSLLGNPLVAGAVALVVVLLGAAGFLRYRRGKQAAAPAEAPPPVEPTVAPAAEAPAPAEEKAAAAAEEVDPLSEADVYLAYGRDAQAEEILKDALARQPSRIELHQKLLEIYAKRPDKRAFEQTARTLQGLGLTGAAWESAQAMGLTIDPQNPLYGGAPAPAAEVPVAEAAVPAAPAPEVAAAPAEIDFDLGAAAPAAGAAAAAAPAAAAEAEKPVSIDFDLGAFSAEGQAPVELKAEAPSDEAPMFDITSVKPDQPASPGMDVPLSGAGGEGASMDIALSDIKLDLGAEGQTPSVVHDARWQEVATKFDLAKMYKEMGDRDGAREILQEVIREGDSGQQEEAKALLATL